MRVLTSTNKAEGRLLLDYNFIDEIPVEMPKSMTKKYNPDLRVLDGDYNTMKPTVTTSPTKKELLGVTTRNKSLKLG